MVLFLMPIKSKDTDYLQKKQSKNESSEESKKRKRGNFFRNFLSRIGVRWARLELAQDYSHYPLKVACLPFHHHRFVLGLQRYAQKLKVQTFLKIFSLFLEFLLKIPRKGADSSIFGGFFSSKSLIL